MKTQLSDYDEVVALAWPVNPVERAKIKALMPNHEAPPWYDDGEERFCAGGCEMLLNVGPRLVASRVTVYCPYCAIKKMNGMDAVDMGHLGNPNARHDK